MSKYVIDIPDGFEWGVATCRTEDGFYTRDFDSLEELNSDYINKHFGGLQAIAKLKAYEEKQNDKIVVGDEICYKDKMRKDTGIVTWRRYDDIYIMWGDGSASRNKVNDYRKTGRHFDIEKILVAMKE